MAQAIFDYIIHRCFITLFLKGSLFFNVSWFQINFFKDHTKIIFDPLLGGVTYIDEQRTPRTYNLELIEKYGCSAELASRLIYAHEKVK